MRFMRHTRIIVTHYGGLNTFQLVEEERPEPRRGEVRVRLLAARVSLPDLMMREGVHPKTPRVPFTPSWDLVGVVDRSAMASLESNQGRQWPRCRSPVRAYCLKVGFNARQSGGLDIGGATRHAFLQPRTSIIRL